nr:2-amino-4-hydroxy-6-hydroxymethyldihydropteridine diphosphokinase [Eubacterium sp.]
MDRIEIKDLVCYCHHGVLKEENVLGQKFLVSASLFMDTRKAGIDDALQFSVDYADVAHTIDELMKENKYHLIEAVAERIAREILLKYKPLHSVEVTIKKPWAPIMLPLDTVSVTIKREWTEVYVGVGSNIGNRRKYIDDAFAGIRNNRLCKEAYMSTIIETEPYGYTEQDNFLNGVICFKTLYSPQELLKFLQTLEESGDRTREIHWGPRTIDLDILFYGNLVLQTEDLIIPHKEVQLRRFVLEPMDEVAPFLVHPVFDKTISQLFKEWKKENE